MHLYLNYAGTVIEILFPTSGTLKKTAEQIFNLEQKLKRRLDVSVDYTELETNNIQYRYENVEDAIIFLAKLVELSGDLKLSAIDKLTKVLNQHNVKYRRTNNLLEFHDRFVNLDYFFSIKIRENGESVYVYYDCENLGDLGSRDYDSIEDVIDDFVKLKELDNKFKSLVVNAPFELDKTRAE